jgi:glycosyltransferase involved in cell wall biosynthesis
MAETLPGKKARKSGSAPKVASPPAGRNMRRNPRENPAEIAVLATQEMPQSDFPRVGSAKSAATATIAPDAVETAVAPSITGGRVVIQSCLDEVSDKGIWGWVMVRERPSHRCVVALREDGQILARTVASRYRADLLTAGVGDGCHAFFLSFPRALFDGEDHVLEVIEKETGLPLNVDPILWRSGFSGSSHIAESVTHLFGDTAPDTMAAPTARGGLSPAIAAAPSASSRVTSAFGKWPATYHLRRPGSNPAAGTRIMFDVSDLVYYIGAQTNLTGIQRVQSSIVLSIVANELCQKSDAIFLSFNTRGQCWVVIPTGFLVSLLQDLFLPSTQRLVQFSADDARHGVLPGAAEFTGVGVLDGGRSSVLCLLGAAWVHRDYMHRILIFKRLFGTRFVMTIHDLIPIYARDTCDQHTAYAFEDFVRRAFRHVDHFLCVSENTAKDLTRYLGSLSLPEPVVTVTRNGSSFAEFMNAESSEDVWLDDIPERFVLFVSTVEGRKNHQLMMEVWRRMIADRDDPPSLICVGRVGWKSESFISDLVETDYLGGKIILLQDISDADLDVLYKRCLFTVYPSGYEGWGLPIGESLSAGKVCVCSDRSSIPEVAGEFGVYINVDDVEQTWRVIRGLIVDEDILHRAEAKIRLNYKPETWHSVAERVIAACHGAAAARWHEPYPFVSIPYSTEISFSWLARNIGGDFGPDLLTHVTEMRRGHFLNNPLKEYNFLCGEEARSMGDWGEPENWGVWLCHADGEIVVGLEPNDSLLYYVFLRLRVTEPIADKDVKLTANGNVAWNGSIGPRPRDLVLRVRRSPARAGRWRLRIRAEVDLTDETRRRILAIDGRMPTIGFERLVVVPENDLKSRLDVMYNMA